MKPRTTLILLAVLVVLGGYVYWTELRQPASSASTTPTPAPVWSYAAEQVVGITIQGGGKQVRLTRPANGAWQLETPQAGPADQDRVTAVLDSLAPLQASRTLTDTTGSLADYGLAQPALSVTLRLTDGSDHALEIGDMTPPQTDYYVQVQGQAPIQLVSASTVQSVQDLLNQPPFPPTPTPTESATPAALQIVTPAATQPVTSAPASTEPGTPAPTLTQPATVTPAS